MSSEILHGVCKTSGAQNKSSSTVALDSLDCSSGAGTAAWI
jgi:hypothetical protein